MSEALPESPERSYLFLDGKCTSDKFTAQYVTTMPVVIGRAMRGDVEVFRFSSIPISPLRLVSWIIYLFEARRLILHFTTSTSSFAIT